jgi:hypothetical protein
LHCARTSRPNYFVMANSSASLLDLLSYSDHAHDAFDK